ncbi:MAG: acylphosphatase [Chitinophagales bacterium]|nr:acylphosphatase [Chitinophagales bacterium]MDW8393148.1 acylphosphatase [Chitinophagales bacterium]
MSETQLNHPALVLYRISIHGRVQGVFFRASARQQAQALGITGIIRNEADGSVYAEAEGKEEAVQQFIQWCRHGPEGAVVTSITAEKSAPKGYTAFEVIRGLQ